jgi:hypothetical protein
MRLIIGNVAQRSRIRAQTNLGYSDNYRRDGNLELYADIKRRRFDPSEQSTVLSLIPIHESNCSFDPKQLHLQTGSREFQLWTSLRSSNSLWHPYLLPLD